MFKRITLCSQEIRLFKFVPYSKISPKRAHYISSSKAPAGRGGPPSLFPGRRDYYLVNASFNLARGISSSISIPLNLAFCFLFVLSFSPFLLSLPSSSSLSSSSLSLLSLCLDFRYSSHLSG